jgi:hypothetical protein
MRLQAPTFPAIACALAIGCSGSFEATSGSPEGTSDGAPDVMVGVPTDDAPVESSSSDEAELGPDVASDASDDGGGSTGPPDAEEASPVVEAGPVPIPTDGLLLWLRADVGVTKGAASGAGAIVTAWSDQSASHFDARQSVLGKQPMWRPGASGGRPAVVFDEDDYLSLPAGFTDFSRGVSAFAVAEIGGTAPCADIFALSNGPEIDDISLGRDNGKAHYEVYSGDIFGDAYSSDGPQMMSVVHGTDWNMALRLDGAPFTTGNFEPPATVLRLSNVVGRSLYTECASINGAIYEILLYGRALDPGERAQVESYLQNHWDCCR